MYEEIGRMIIEFSQLDSTVSFVYEIFHKKGRKQATAGLPDSVKARLECCTGMVVSRARAVGILDDPSVVKLLLALSDAKAIAEDRNLFAHGEVCTINYGPEDEPDFAIVHRHRTKTRTEDVTLESIIALRRRISETHQTLHTHLRDVWLKVAPPENRHPRAQAWAARSRT
jgi:hypothetical protein